MLTSPVLYSCSQVGPPRQPPSALANQTLRKWAAPASNMPYPLLLQVQQWLAQEAALPPGNGSEAALWSAAATPAVAVMSDAEKAQHEGLKLKMQKAMGAVVASQVPAPPGPSLLPLASCPVCSIMIYDCPQYHKFASRLARRVAGPQSPVLGLHTLEGVRPAGCYCQCLSIDSSPSVLAAASAAAAAALLAGLCCRQKALTAR